MSLQTSEAKTSKLMVLVSIQNNHQHTQGQGGNKICHYHHTPLDLRHFFYQHMENKNKIMK